MYIPHWHSHTYLTVSPVPVRVHAHIACALLCQHSDGCRRCPTYTKAPRRGKGLPPNQTSCSRVSTHAATSSHSEYITLCLTNPLPLPTSHATSDIHSFTCRDAMASQQLGRQSEAEPTCLPPRGAWWWHARWPWQLRATSAAAAAVTRRPCHRAGRALRPLRRRTLAAPQRMTLRSHRAAGHGQPSMVMNYRGRGAGFRFYPRRAPLLADVTNLPLSLQ